MKETVLNRKQNLIGIIGIILILIHVLSYWVIRWNNFI